jgi:hypothetical protein
MERVSLHFYTNRTYLRRNELVEPETNVIYLGPHRPWRKSTLSGVAMYSLPYSYRELSQMDMFSDFQQFVPSGLQLLQNTPGQVRDSDTADEAYGTARNRNLLVQCHRGGSSL